MRYSARRRFGALVVSTAATTAADMLDGKLLIAHGSASANTSNAFHTMQAAVKTDKGYAITVKLVEAPPVGTPEAGPGTDIVLDGDRFSYKRSIPTPDGTLVITYTGVVSGDRFTGTVDLGGFAQAPYTGVRITR